MLWHEAGLQSMFWHDALLLAPSVLVGTLGPQPDSSFRWMALGSRGHAKAMVPEAMKSNLVSARVRTGLLSKLA